MSDRKASLFIVGVQKGGTTALHEMLTRHPQILGGFRKELHLFDTPGPGDPAHDRRAFASAFPPDTAGGRYRLDATPIYCFWPGAAERMQRCCPEARVVLVLRHPAFRAHSHWRMETRRGQETLSFEAALERSDRRRPDEAPDQPSRVYSYLERGFYAVQVQRLLRLFPAGSLRFVRTDDLWRAPAQTLLQMADWLGLDPGPFAGLGARYTVPVATRDLGQADPATMARLTTRYAKDIALTAQLTGLDLSDWLTAGYLEPMAPEA